MNQCEAKHFWLLGKSNLCFYGNMSCKIVKFVFFFFHGTKHATSRCLVMAPNVVIGTLSCQPWKKRTHTEARRSRSQKP